jgi:hypothetical protein
MQRNAGSGIIAFCFTDISIREELIKDQKTMIF